MIISVFIFSSLGQCFHTSQRCEAKKYSKPVKKLRWPLQGSATGNMPYILSVLHVWSHTKLTSMTCSKTQFWRVGKKWWVDQKSLVAYIHQWPKIQLFYQNKQNSLFQFSWTDTKGKKGLRGKSFSLPANQSVILTVSLSLSVYLFVYCTVCLPTVLPPACLPLCLSAFLFTVSVRLVACLSDDLRPPPPSLCLSLHRPTGACVRPGEQHSRRPASEDRLWRRRGTEGFCESWGTLLPERKRPDGEERTRLWGALSKSGKFIAHTSVSSFKTLQP